jgi:polyphosphate:AMP phosphotransferase
MFEAAEVGRSVSKAEFKEREQSLATELLDAQRAAREQGMPIIIVVSGVEGAGKGQVIDQLTEWLDTRGVETHAFWDETDEERERPRFWRFFRALPARGTVGIMFGSWYTSPIVEHAFGRSTDDALEAECVHICNFERMLVRDGALILKFWFHLSRDAQQQRLAAERDAKAMKGSPLLKKYAKLYPAFARTSERALRLTDTPEAPWHVIEAHDARYRDLTAAETLLAAIRARLAHPAEALQVTSHLDETANLPVPATARTTMLDHLDLAASVDGDTYGERLDKLQRQINRLAWRAREERVSCIAVFEGADAAGKGGAIRRITSAIDARLFRVIRVAAPTDEERAHHYLWRFWRHVPRAGSFTLYDRSWYGRLLVERVEGFARPDAWARAFAEINMFEEELTDHGIVLLKFWLHIDPDEQLRRFREREATPWKRHKITAEDWRNRDKFGDYVQAANDMFARTSTSHAPWTLVAANDKRHARLTVLETVRDRLRDRLG